MKERKLLKKSIRDIWRLDDNTSYVHLVYLGSIFDEQFHGVEIAARSGAMNRRPITLT